MDSSGNQWLKVEELGYQLPAPPKVTLCFYCSVPLVLQQPPGRPDEEQPWVSSNIDSPTAMTKTFVRPSRMRCGSCQVAAYCSKECQVNDWKGIIRRRTTASFIETLTPPPSSSSTGSSAVAAAIKSTSHKMACASYRRVGIHQVLSTAQDRQEAREQVWLRIRTMACLYAVFKARILGRGFLFIQSPHSLSYMSLSINKDVYGRSSPTPRSVLIHYLTMGEYSAELCRDDFELTLVRSELQQAVADYNEMEKVVVLMRFRCGQVAVGRLGLVPDYQVGQKLGTEYFASTVHDNKALQLDLDDVVDSPMLAG